MNFTTIFCVRKLDRSLLADRFSRFSTLPACDRHIDGRYLSTVPKVRVKDKVRISTIRFRVRVSVPSE